MTQKGSWNYTYFATGTLKTLEKPSGSSTGTVGDGTITYGYDRMSRQTSVGYSDTPPDVTRAYDPAGRLDTMTDGPGSVDYTFDDADRLTDMARTGGGAGLNGTLPLRLRRCLEHHRAHLPGTERRRRACSTRTGA